jgi:hypothetical protein
VVGDLEDRVLALRVQPDDGGRAWRRVRADVAEQVGEHLPDPRLVGGDHQAVRHGRGDLAVRLDRPGVRHGVPGQDGQVGLRQVERRGPVKPGKFEQLGDEHGHALRLLLDAPHRVRQFTGPERVRPVQLRVAPDGGQRGTQLVRGIRGELPDLLLRAQPGAEGLLDLLQHRVDRRG